MVPSCRRTCRQAKLSKACSNAKTCHAQVPIVRSIPRFVSSESYASSFGFQWNRFDRLQVDSVMHNDLSRDRFYATTGWPSSLNGERILEAGCGTGRFTELVTRNRCGGTLIRSEYSCRGGGAEQRWESELLRFSRRASTNYLFARARSTRFSAWESCSIVQKLREPFEAWFLFSARWRDRDRRVRKAKGVSAAQVSGAAIPATTGDRRDLSAPILDDSAWLLE